VSEPAVDPQRQPILRSVEGVDRIDALYAADRWVAASLGIPAQRHQGAVDFSGISQPWLREALQRWARHAWPLEPRSGPSTPPCRVSEGCPGSSLRARRLSTDPKTSTGWWSSATCPGSPNRSCRRPPSTVQSCSCEVFWKTTADTGGSRASPRTRSSTTTRAPHERRRCRGSSPSSRWPRSKLRRTSPSSRNLIVVLTETGLRSGDAFSLAFDPLAADSTGWPCLRFWNRKMGAEQFVPLSAAAAEAVRAQQRHVTDTWPGGSPWLFPSASDPALPQSYSAGMSSYSVMCRRPALP
jgi:hypothetical protein